MRATKIFTWEMAHKLSQSYTTKCQHIHGHSYRAEITLAADKFDENGVVIDFSRIKQVLSGLIDSFDHSFMFFSGDTQALAILPSLLENKLRVIECDFEPTAENIAAFLFDYLSQSDKLILARDAERGLYVASVKVWETANCFAKVDAGLNLPYHCGHPLHMTFHNC